MLSMVRLWNKKCSGTGPNRPCSGPEQDQVLFRYDHYMHIRISSVCTVPVHVPFYNKSFIFLILENTKL